MSEGEAEPAGAPPARIARRVEDSFREVYLTLVSIIQGVALGWLVQTIGPDYRHLTADQIGRALAVFAFIIAVWQEYMVGSTMFAWVPGVLDSLTPFLLGLGECLAVSAVTDSISAYLLLTTCTWAVGLLAEVNYYKRVVSSLDGGINQHAYQVLGAHPRTGLILGSSGAAVAMILWLCSLFLHGAMTSTVLSWLSAVPALAGIASGHRRWTRRIRDVLPAASQR